MILLVPFVYVFVCMLAALLMFASRKLRFWQMLALTIILTPVGAWFVCLFLKKRPAAYCMKRYDIFDVGRPYGYRKVVKQKREYYEVYNDKIYRLSPATFHRHFSMVSERESPTASLISERKLDKGR